MRKLKSILSVVLALCMLLSTVPVALAEETNTPTAYDVTIDACMGAPFNISAPPPLGNDEPSSYIGAASLSVEAGTTLAEMGINVWHDAEHLPYFKGWTVYTWDPTVEWWTEEKDSDGKFVVLDTATMLNTPITEDVRFEPSWETYTVIFEDIDGGTFDQVDPYSGDIYRDDCSKAGYFVSYLYNLEEFCVINDIKNGTETFYGWDVYESVEDPSNPEASTLIPLEGPISIQDVLARPITFDVVYRANWTGNSIHAHSASPDLAGVKAATCTAEGYTGDKVCASCGEVLEKGTTIEKLAHTEVTVAGKAPTCTETGLTEGKKCSVCGTVTVEQTTITAVSHQLTKTEAVAANCTTAGTIEYYTCSACNGIFSDAEGKTAITTSQIAVAATGHKLTKVEAAAPTYTAAGNIEHYTCACGALFADAEGKTATTAEAVKLAQLIKIEETKAEVSTDAVDTAIKEAETTGSITIDLVEIVEEEAAKPESGSGSDTTTKPAPVVFSAALPVASLQKVAEISEETTLTVNMTEVTVTMDAKTMAAVAEQSAGETVTLKVEKVETKTLTEEQQAVIEDKEVAAVVSATLISNNVAISDFNGGSVTLSIPFSLPDGAEGSDFQIYYVADDGTMTAHDTEYVNGCLVFSTTHFSDYVVVNTAKSVDPTVPNTGDEGHLMFFTTMLLIAAAGVYLTSRKLRRA